MDKFILAIDAGTTSSRAILFDKNARPIEIAQYEFNQIFPKEGWVEHDPIEIWNTQFKAINDVIKSANIDVQNIDSVGITNQRETTVIWNKKTGQPVYNAIVWQDRRTANFCDDLKNNNKTEFIQNKTGLVIDAYFSGTKIKWILDNHPKIRLQADDGELLFGTIDTWLIWNLTNGESHITDPSNASRTLLYNIQEDRWDDELISLFNVPKNILPKVVDSSSISAYVDSKIFGFKAPISGIAGDQQAALFGQLCLNRGDIKNTYGTGCFCVMNTGNKFVKSNNKMLSTIAWRINGELTYALEGSIFVAGALIQWLRDKLGIIKNASEVESLAKTVDNNGGVTFIPALSGLAAPYWDPYAQGAIFGITRGTQNGHIARAALESIALRTRDIIIEMEKDANIKFSSLKVDGGASNNNLLMQIQSDILDTNVIRPKTTETTALGVAFLAGLATGFFNDIPSLKKLWVKDRSFKPILKNNSNQIVGLWSQRINKLLS
ncbi:MAG: glycerol kinase [Flavobacteriaceae bacterium]|nr:glycerol kinase [Flavobacteriaceae bacterium]|tara:strand:+ start:2678 stop:4156 length:1479 start_codon:yes stop_codon:yes gene_type:complete